MVKRISLPVFAVLFCCHGILLGDEPSAERFGRSVVDSNVRLRNAGFDFGKQLAPILQGAEPDAAGLAATYAKLVRTLTQVREDMEKMKYPESEAAKDLFDAHQQFLQGQLTMIGGDLADILVIAVDRGMDVDSKKRKIEKLLEAMTQREQADGAKLLPALEAYVEFYALDVSGWFDE